MDHREIIAREGLPFVLAPTGAAVAAWLAGLAWIGGALFLFALFAAWFFRNPERRSPEGEGLVVSPADGKVIRIEETDPPEFISGPCRKISIFMNVFNVHVNRAPLSGTVMGVQYHPGRFLSANLDKASALNERNTLWIRSDAGKDIVTIQIAGLVARRIVCWVKQGMHMHRGDRFGLIRFGSRLEVFLPLEATVAVRVGDRVRAGVTPIGGLP